MRPSTTSRQLTATLGAALLAAAVPGVATSGVSTPGVSTPGVSTRGVSTPVTTTPNQPAAANIQLAARAITSGELVRVKKLRRDMAAVRGSLPNSGPSPFQDRATLDKTLKRFQQFTDAIKRYNSFDHPEVLAAREDYLALRQALSDEHARAKAQVNALGDVQGELRELEAGLHQHKAPAALTAPFNTQTAEHWVAASVAAKQGAQAALQRLPQIAADANLANSEPGTVQQGARYDKQDLNRLSRLASGTVQKVDAAYASTMANLKAQLDGVNRELDYFRQLDPDNANHRANAFLKEGAAPAAHARLDGFLAIARSAEAFLAAFGKPPSEGLQARLNEIEQLKRDYDAKREQAAGAYRLPSAASSDPALLAIAEQIMAKPKYKFGKHGPIVLTTAAVVEREREESEKEFTDVDVSLSGDITLTGTETTWTYRWQEFKFATPVQGDGGDWHVWWITARNFSSGGGNTPIGEWVSGKAVKGSLIRPENF